MKVEAWLGRAQSAVNGIALIRVEANEPAAIEEMVRLVDGETGFFGVRAELIGTEGGFDKDAWLVARRRRHYAGRGHATQYVQFGFPPASQLLATVRYYEVFVHRD